jgi:putative endonuclease
LDSRTKQHENGKGAKYTRAHKPQRIVYIEVFDARDKAMKREREIKKLNHQQKLELANSQNKK